MLMKQKGLLHQYKTITTILNYAGGPFPCVQLRQCSAPDTFNHSHQNNHLSLIWSFHSYIKSKTMAKVCKYSGGGGGGGGGCDSRLYIA